MHMCDACHGHNVWDVTKYSGVSFLVHKQKASRMYDRFPSFKGAEKYGICPHICPSSSSVLFDASHINSLLNHPEV